MKYTDLWYAGWMECPAATTAGRHTPHPLGDPEVGRRAISRDVRKRLPALRSFCADAKRARDWIERTEWAALSRSANSQLPPAHTGFFSPTPSGAIRMTLPVSGSQASATLGRTMQVAGVWETTLVSTLKQMPTTRERAAVHHLAGFLSGMFRTITGEYLAARVLYPASELELRFQPDPTFVHTVAITTSLPGAAFERRGLHCDDRIDGNGEVSRWLCPLRQSGACDAWGY